MIPQDVRWTLAAAIATISTVGIGLSLSIPLLSLRMEIAGFSARSIGFNTALGAMATLAFAPLVPRAARYFGAADGAAEQQDFPDRRQRGVGPYIGPGLGRVGWGEDFDQEDWVGDIVFFSFVA